MFSTFFWFNIPLPEEQVHLPFENNTKARLNSKLIVEEILKCNLLSEFSEVELQVASICVQGNTMFNKRRGNDRILLKIYEEIHCNFSLAHGAAYLLDWDERRSQSVFKYEFFKFENGYLAKKYVSFDVNGT